MDDPGSLTPCFSIVIPTYQRREVVRASVEALAHLCPPFPAEVIVVVDGSTDGTAGALDAVSLPFPLVVLEQPNSGAAAARNAGAAAATGNILLFLDDDMEAAPDILTAHAESYSDGADAVMGHVPLHPLSPTNFLSRGVGGWAERRRRRLAKPDATLNLFDLLTGQLSVRRDVFFRLGGFDGEFTRDGTFGDEDLDFGYRLLREGYRVVFNAAAVSQQRYVVTPRAYLRQWHEAGRADVRFARKHPPQAAALFALHHAEATPTRRIIRPLASASLIGGAACAVIRAIAVPMAERWPGGRLSERVFFGARDLEYWRGVHVAGGIPRRHPVRVLAYHAIADLAHDQLLAQYGIPAPQFRSQLEALRADGFTFISPDELLRYLRDGADLPRRPVLVTFDDCYEDLLTAALPVLREYETPAVAFAVAGHLGGTNEWDQRIGATTRRLLGADGLRALAASGVEIGAHSLNHKSLPMLTSEELENEIAGAIASLTDAGLRRPRLFAYPYGEHDATVRQAVADADLEAAFALGGGLVRYRADPLRVARIEILRSDTGRKFLQKVRGAKQLSHA